MTRRSRALETFLAATLSLTCACGGEPAPAPRVAEAVRPPPTAAADPGDERTSAVEAQRAVTEALRFISGIRELPIQGTVNSRVLTRLEMAERVREHIRKEIPPDVVAGQTHILLSLGLVPEDFDLIGSFVSLMSTELAGFYEPADRTMYLAADLKGAEREATLSHELVHALQDQHFGLGDALGYKPDQGDAQTAVHALAEGDATSAMLDQMLYDRGQTALDLPAEAVGVQVRAAMELSAAAANAVPGIIRRSVVAPYVDGLGFVHAVRRKGGWQAVNEVWRRPPSSTEQILHPEKLDPREEPETVEIPGPAAGGPSRLLYSDVMGEQGVRLVFEEWLPRSVAVEAASAWAGDRIAVYRDPDGTAALWWHIRWDHGSAGERGFEALVRTALAAQGSDEPDPKAAARGAVKQERFCIPRRGGGFFSVRRKGRDAWVLVGPYGPSKAVPAGDCAGALRVIEEAFRAVVQRP